MRRPVTAYMPRVLSCIGMSLLCSSALAQAVPSGEPFELPRTFEYRVESKITGWTYRVLVAVPNNYELSATAARRYPVLYMLDGGLYLPRAATAFRGVTADGAGSVILVGVGRPGGAPLGQPVTPGNVPNRVYDLSPTPNSPPVGGGAPDFLRVLKEELIPLVDREFRTTGDRGLFGHSMGGLFATYVLITDPDAFSRYGISSPSLFWDDQEIFARESRFAASRSSLAKRVHVSVGGGEGAFMVVLAGRLVLALCQGILAKSYQGLELTSQVLDGEIHESPLHLLRVVDALYPTASSRPLPDPC